MKKFIVYLCSALIVAFSIPSIAQEKYNNIDRLILRSNQLGLFNGNLLVIDHGKEIYRKSIGYADASQQILLKDQYRFHIGSIAKEFNAVAIMMLQEKGKLSIDDKIFNYLTSLPDWAKKISIKNLLQYTSGLPDLKWNTIQGDAAAMDSLQKVVKLDFEPGTQYAYNNSNTLLQRQLVEKITGMRFADFVTTQMLQPLKMSSALVDPTDESPLTAKSYTNGGIQSPLKAPISGWTAVTLNDFYKWELALEHFSLIGPEATKIILTPFSPGKQCGLGSGTMIGNQLATHTHDGTLLNYQALLTCDVEKGRTVILLTNNKQNSLYDINGAIQNILDEKPYVQPKKQVFTPLLEMLNNANGNELLATYQELKAKYPNDYNFDAESGLNVVGYTLINKKRIDDAILIFNYNTKLFPKSGNVFDSLAEAYDIKGNKALALSNYQHAFKLDPTNTAAKEKIAKLQKE